jgi:hypothetical protein
MRAIILAVVVAVLAGCVPLPVIEPERDPEQEYYRGMYDVCLMLTGDEALCNDFADRAQETDWYGQPSPGWDALTPDPSPAGRGEAAAGNADLRQ